MVSAATIVAMGFTLIVCLFLPVALPTFLCVSKKIHWKPVPTGLSVFSATQVLFRMPLLSLFGSTSLYERLAQSPWLLGILLVLSSALLENWGRYAGMRLFARDCISYRDGLAYGLGHGGVEALVLMGMTSLNNLYIALAVNNGKFAEMTAAADPEQAQAVLDVLTETPSVEFFMAGAERLMVVIIQIALSLLVFVALQSGRRRWVWYAVCAQCVVNYPIYLMQNGSMWVAEGYIALCTVLSIVFIFTSRKRFFTPKNEDAPAK